MKNATRRFGMVAALLGLMVGAAGQARAGQVLGVDFASNGGQNSTSIWSLGYQFRADQQVSVTELGTFDYDHNGFSQSQQVGLWTLGGTLLASTFVGNSDTLEGNWRFHSIGPVTLQAGQEYVVASQGGEGYTYGTSGFTVAPQITYEGSRYHYLDSTSNTPLYFPEVHNGINGYFGGNVKFGDAAPVPEPSTIVSAGIAGMMGLGYAWRRRKARSAA